MEARDSLLSQLLLETIAPVVMVIPTLLVEESCKKNNLNFVQMLQPFCLFDNIDVPVRTASEQPYRLQKFKIRMFYASDIQQVPIELAEENLGHVVENAAEKAFSELQGSLEHVKLEAIQRMSNSESLSSWLQMYNQEYIQTLSFSEHEAFDHPVACLLVVSSKDENPINKFVDLFNTDQLPSLFSDGAMDPKILKHFVLLHDYQDGPTDNANEILLEMKKTFGKNECRLLCINSLQGDDSSLPNDIWSPLGSLSKQNNPSAFSTGRHLSKSDIEGLFEFMQDFSAKNVIPYMEQRIRSLNQHVSATRKGFKNQIKNLWWRKGKEDAVDATNGSTYSFSSIESQIRVLGDYAFILHDYELALSNYRLLSTDYKLDKAWKRFAGVQEMIGLSLFMMDQSRKEAEYSMETAFTTYQKIGVSGQRYAIRCAIWWAEMHKSRYQFKEAANVYFRGSSEEPSLRVAVLLEQGAYCYVRMNPPMLRKYAFHLILSGNRYNASGQGKHALRVYRSALPVFEGEGWNYIRDHINYSLGRWYGNLGRPDLALKFLMKLLACSHQPAATQEAYLADFLSIFKVLGTSDEMLELNLPVINMSSLRVHFGDHRTYASQEAVLLPERTWQSLEEGLIPSIPQTVPTWLDSATKSTSRQKKSSSYKICISGETITVDLEFQNPLCIPVDLSAVSLVCKFLPQKFSEREDTSMETEASDQKDILITEDKNTLENDSTEFTVSGEAFSLKGGQSITVPLKVTPTKEGILHIVGVKWVLSRTVAGQFQFASQLQNKSAIKRNQELREDALQHLKFYVLKHLPRIEGIIHRMPVKANIGEIHRLVLELSNQSDEPIKNIKLKVSHPRFLILGEQGDLDAEFPMCLEAKNKSDNNKVSAEGDALNALSNSSVSTFPKDTIVEGRSTLLWPLWLHACASGPISLCMSIYYEMEAPTENISYRILRMAYTLQVSQSLDISVHISPWTSQIQQFLLQFEIHNNSPESFWLRQLSALGTTWKLSSLEPSLLSFGKIEEESQDHASNSAFLSASVSPSQLLPAGESTTLFFKLMDISTFQSSVCSDGLNSFLHHTTDLQLGPPSSSEPIFDVANGPIFKFHLEERKVQKEAFMKTPRQPSTISEEYGTVDLILIAEQQDESLHSSYDNLRDIQKLSSHHLCCSIARSPCPIWWVMQGPKTINHDFNSHPFCEIQMDLTIKNCSNIAVSVQVETSDSTSLMNETSDTGQVSSAQYQSGWYDINLEKDDTGKVKAEAGHQSSVLFVPNKYIDSKVFVSSLPFMWCSLSSANIRQLQPWASATTSLSVAVFAPGTYDLSRYTLQWKVNADTDHSLTELGVVSLDSKGMVHNIHNSYDMPSSGRVSGHQFYLTVLQSGQT